MEIQLFIIQWYKLFLIKDEGNYKVSMMLIKKGVDCSIKNTEGKIAFDLLKDNQMRGILISYSENVKNGFSD